jgi:hypothetical protein
MVPVGLAAALPFPLASPDSRSADHTASNAAQFRSTQPASRSWRNARDCPSGALSATTDAVARDVSRLHRARSIETHRVGKFDRPDYGHARTAEHGDGEIRK